MVTVAANTHQSHPKTAVYELKREHNRIESQLNETRGNIQTRDELSSSYEYLLDSGATTHVMISEEDATDIKEATGDVLVGNGERCKTSRVAKYVLEEKTTRSQIELSHTVIMPGFGTNIISMLRLLDDGYQFDINKERCLMTKQDDKEFRIELQPGNKGAYYLNGRMTIPNSRKEPIFNEEKGENITRRDRSSVAKSMHINNLHGVLGHKGKELLRKTWKQLGIKVSREIKACNASEIASKAKQRSM